MGLGLVGMGMRMYRGDYSIVCFNLLLSYRLTMWLVGTIVYRCVLFRWVEVCVFFVSMSFEGFNL